VRQLTLLDRIAKATAENRGLKKSRLRYTALFVARLIARKEAEFEKFVLIL
jgi:hypothetical protein